MTFPAKIAWLAAGLIVTRWLAEVCLARLNRRHVLAHAGSLPPAFKDIMDEATYARSVEYTLAQSRLAIFSDTYGMLVLLAALFSGLLPYAFEILQQHTGNSVWFMAAFLFAVGVAMSLPRLPVAWFEQFRLEQKFGFNTSNQKTWWFDRVKMLLLAAALGYPVLVLLLKFVDWAGDEWWLWAWVALLAFQILMMVFAPVLILPLFNKFTALPLGSLRDRLLALGERTGFRAQSIQVMDGSKRSRHSNAFFTGFGRFRKIVLFDTLIAHLAEPELEAVLAHEIGHCQRKHIPKLLAWSMVSSLVTFYAIAVLARQDWFYRAFGFAPGNVTLALLVFGLFSGTVTFWLSPLQNAWMRRYEYEADAFAAQVMNGAQPLVAALRKLSEKNLSNLTPHPAYSAFHYSHPTLLERERALMAS